MKKELKNEELAKTSGGITLALPEEEFMCPVCGTKMKSYLKEIHHIKRPVYRCPNCGKERM